MMEADKLSMDGRIRGHDPLAFAACFVRIRPCVGWVITFNPPLGGSLYYHAHVTDEEAETWKALANYSRASLVIEPMIEMFLRALKG